MIDFTIENGKVVVDAATLTVSAFNDIWEFDKSKSKAHASNMLTYVFHTCDLRDKNPLKDVAFDARPSASKRSVFGNAEHKFSAEEQPLIDRASKWYQVLNEKSIERFSAAIDRKLDEATAWMENPDNKIDSAEKLEVQLKVIGGFDKILKTKKETDAYVREVQAKQKVQNNAKRSALSSGMLK